MLNLPNGCYCSEPKVFPKNWKTRNASIKTTWYIHYRFYDPSSKESGRPVKSVQRFIKGMNKLKVLHERQALTQYLLETELNILKIEGYNPLKNISAPDHEIAGSINFSTPMATALNRASESINAGSQVKIAIRSVLKYVKQASDILGISNIPVSETRRKHIRAILDKCGHIKTNWSAYNYNFYRAYLMMLFKEIIEYEAIDQNPVREIQKQKIVKKIRPILSQENRKKIDTYLKEKSYPFWRFMHIFFHSGARETELLTIKVKDVDLAGQRYKVIIKKGKSHNEVMRTIKDVALPLWKEVLSACGPEDYLFSRGLVPGQTQIGSAQISRRWKRHVKDNENLKITEDFYSLKHLNTTQTVDLLNEEDAAAMNAHTSTAMVVNIYDTAQERRRHERLKKVNNSFS